MQLRIKYWREKRGFTLKEVAEKVGGIEGAAIWKYENGIVSPTLERLEAIARVLNVTVADLMPRRANKLTPETPEEAAHVG